MILFSCSKKSHDELNDIANTKNFFNDVINNTSYYFSFNKNNDFLSFDPKKNYSVTWTYQKSEVNEYQKQQKIFLKFNFLKKFYLEKIGTIFCLPLITKIGETPNNGITKDYQKELFKFQILDKNEKDDNNEIKEIIIEFTKKQLEDTNKGTNFDVGQNEYEMIFIVSIFSKSLSFESIDDLEKQKNDIGTKSVNIFLHLKLKKKQ